MLLLGGMTLMPTSMMAKSDYGWDDNAEILVNTPILAFMSNGNLLDQNESLEKCQIIEMLRDYIYLEIRDYELNRESLLQEILDKINNGRAFTRAKDDPEYSGDNLTAQS